MDEHYRHDANKWALLIDSRGLNVGLESGDRLTGVDARSPEAYAAVHRPGEHYPGAINIPHRDMEGAAATAIGKSSTVVVDGDGLGCHASIKGALNMTTLGFAVKALMGGLDWWKRDVSCACA